MTVIHKNKAVFIHVPKTGGMSIVKTLKPNAPANHKKYEHRSDIKDYYKFMFVRNPYSRVYSAFNYSYKMGVQKINTHKFQARNIATRVCRGKFDKFVLEHLHKVKHELHFRPAMTWYNPRIDFIGKFENLQEDFNIVKGMIEFDGDLLSLNRSHSPNPIYTPEMTKIVKSIYLKDFRRFGYSFDNPYEN